MKPKEIVYDAAFEKKFEKYKKQLTESERKRFKKQLEIFKEDIFDKRLNTHKLKGNLSDYYAFSISYSDRIVFKILDDGSIYLIEIGSHDICY
ncbi:MAG: type II toxin-antitoxin system mRNA interferase toxin, RelE/StbE family [Nitrospinae bacterium]|nr:type II toxin-antitoxin system mRNA interferase toxin, RelE/StbE family [Nitrospinota bacterium]